MTCLALSPLERHDLGKSCVVRGNSPVRIGEGDPEQPQGLAEMQASCPVVNDSIAYFERRNFADERADRWLSHIALPTPQVGKSDILVTSEQRFFGPNPLKSLTKLEWIS